MSYSIDWIVDGRVLYIRNEGKLSSTEVKALSEQFEQMSDNAAGQLHVIEDDREFTGFSDMDIGAVIDMFRAMDFENLGWAVAIMPDKLEGIADIVGGIMEMLTRSHYERVETMPQALSFIQVHDATLPRMSEWHLPEDMLETN